MRESLARAVNSSDMGMEIYTTDVDLVAAMSAGTHLGSYLLRVRDAGQTEFSHKAMLLLAHKIIKRFRLSRKIAENVAAQALIEWLRPHCRCCGGTKQIIVDKIIPCHQCGGSGVHRFTDTERRVKIGAGGRSVSDGLDYAQRIITQAACGMAVRARARLG